VKLEEPSSGPRLGSTVRPPHPPPQRPILEPVPPPELHWVFLPGCDQRHGYRISGRRKGPFSAGIVATVTLFAVFVSCF